MVREVEAKKYVFVPKDQFLRIFNKIGVKHHALTFRIDYGYMAVQFHRRIRIFIHLVFCIINLS